MPRRPRRVNSYTNFAREFNPGYHSAANRAARRAYAASWFGRAARVGAGIGAVGAAAAANYFATVPKLDTSPITMPRWVGFKRPPLAGAVVRGRKKAKTSTDPSGSYVQLRREKATVGTELGEVTKLSKLIHAHAAVTIDRWQNVTNLNDGAGAFRLGYNNPSGTYRQFPFYLFDLTGIKNVFGTGTSACDPYPMMQLHREVANGRYLFFHVDGKTNTDGSSPLWQEERKAALLNSNAKERALFEWFDIKMILYGARACPTWIEVAIVQFTDEEMAPLCLGDIGTSANQVIEPDVSNYTGAVPTTAEYNRWQTAWQGTVDNLIGSTITQRNLAETSKFMKFKFRKRFNFNPTGSETDQTGHQVQFKLKYLMNKICDFVGNPTEWDEVPVANEVNPNIWPTFDTHKFSAVPPAKGREFLLIRSFAPDYNPVDQNAKNCSFDLMVRRKRTIIRS